MLDMFFSLIFSFLTFLLEYFIPPHNSWRSRRTGTESKLWSWLCIAWKPHRPQSTLSENGTVCGGLFWSLSSNTSQSFFCLGAVVCSNHSCPSHFTHRTTMVSLFSQFFFFRIHALVFLTLCPGLSFPSVSSLSHSSIFQGCCFSCSCIV